MIKRRQFLLNGGVLAACMPLAAPADPALGGTEGEISKAREPGKKKSSVPQSDRAAHRAFNSSYRGDHLNYVAFPIGGIGAGMFCIDGTGALSHVSIRNHPDIFNEPCMFAAIAGGGKQSFARVLEGPVPGWKIFGGKNGGMGMPSAASSSRVVPSSFGLPRFAQASFESRFPFGCVTLTDDSVPLEVEITGWSPFTPGEADQSSLPVAALEYRLTNRSSANVEATFSFNALNFMVASADPLGSDVRPSPSGVLAAPGGFTLWGQGPSDKPWLEGWFQVAVHDEPKAKVNHAWFRGPDFDAITMAWKDIESGAVIERAPVTDDPAPGSSIFVPVSLVPGDEKIIRLRLCWYVPKTSLGGSDWPDFDDQNKPPADGETYKPWYAGRFSGIEEVAAHWAQNYDVLRHRSDQFSRCFYDTTLPREVVEAVAANLSILKSPTILRQADGRMWAWEGCQDDAGSSFGTCTHVWNYAQAICHLFPSLERGLRETEFGPSQEENGYQRHRAALPIRAVAGEPDDLPPAADGQLGGIMKIHRDWRIGGDTAWLRSWWPKVRKSLDYCITTWDPSEKGWLEEPHKNTYDMKFYGPNGMCTSIYLGALTAAIRMGEALHYDVSRYRRLYELGSERMVRDLFNGEYFEQKIEWKSLRAFAGAKNDMTSGSPERNALEAEEGPCYQYGSGCLSDGVLGAWLATNCGLPEVVDRAKVVKHLLSVYRYNFRSDLSAHANPQRPGYAVGHEGGLILCSWPRGNALSLPFNYSNEVWTGVEYQVASHLISSGQVEPGLSIVRACRARYDGRVRNPFDEYEWGHWYARALASYALLQALSGARYDAVDQILYLKPAIKGDFRSFLSTATGFGTVGVKDGKPFVDVVSGTIPFDEIRYVAAPSR